MCNSGYSMQTKILVLLYLFKDYECKIQTAHFKSELEISNTKLIPFNYKVI